MDHRALIASLTDEDRLELTRRSDLPGVVRFAAHFGGILALGAAVAVGVPFWPLLILPLGILIVFLFTTLHETIHETAFRTAWLNRWVALVSGFLVLVPPVWFRYFHFAHHRHTHDPDNDPELMSPKPETWGAYLVYASGWRYWTGMAKTVLGNARGTLAEPYVPPKGRTKVVAEARSFAAAYALLLAVSIVAGSALLFWVWVLPALVGQPFLRLYLLAEHGRCPHVSNMLENTRTTFTTRLVRLIAWNMPYHAEHHAYPAVPFHRLPDFHAFTQAHLKSTERGYFRFNRSFAKTLR